MNKPFHWLKLTLVAAMLCLAPKAQALYTPYMVGLSNELSAYAQFLGTSTNSTDLAEARALNRAVLALKGPSDTVAKDYQKYFTAVSRAGKFAFTDPNLLNAGTNTFKSFMIDAFVHAFTLNGRLNELNKFVPGRASASNLIFQVANLIQQNAAETNLTRGLLRGFQIFRKLGTAEKLVTRGEANQGFAANSLAGTALSFTNRTESGVISFSENQFALLVGENIENGTYTYTRTGLNTGKLVLFENSGGTNTLKLTFKSSSTAGNYTRQYNNGSTRSRSAGKFTLEPLPPI